MYDIAHDNVLKRDLAFAGLPPLNAGGCGDHFQEVFGGVAAARLLDETQHAGNHHHGHNDDDSGGIDVVRVGPQNIRAGRDPGQAE